MCLFALAESLLISSYLSIFLALQKSWLHTRTKGNAQYHSFEANYGSGQLKKIQGQDKCKSKDSRLCTSRKNFPWGDTPQPVPAPAWVPLSAAVIPWAVFCLKEGECGSKACVVSGTGGRAMMILKQRVKTVPWVLLAKELIDHVQGQNCPVLEYSAQHSTEAPQTQSLWKNRGDSLLSLRAFPNI